MQTRLDDIRHNTDKSVSHGSATADHRETVGGRGSTFDAGLLHHQIHFIHCGARKKRRMLKERKMKQSTFVIMNIIVKHSARLLAPLPQPPFCTTLLCSTEFATSKSSLLRVTPIIRGSFKKVKIGETPTMSQTNKNTLAQIIISFIFLYFFLPFFSTFSLFFCFLAIRSSGNKE